MRLNYESKDIWWLFMTAEPGMLLHRLDSSSIFLFLWTLQEFYLGNMEAISNETKHWFLKTLEILFKEFREEQKPLNILKVTIQTCSLC